MKEIVLSYVEEWLPGASTAERIALAQRHGLALEIADRPGFAWEELARTRVPVVTLQAYGMHELHPLHPDLARRAAAAEYVRAVLERAARHGIPRVLTACGFDPCITDRAAERCLDFFAGLAPRARALGVRILIEPLSPRRASAMSSPAAVAELLRALAAPEIFAAALDSGHLWDAGLDPAAVLERFEPPLEELQLRGPDSAPPPADLPLRDWLLRARSRPSIVCIEHRTALAEPALARLIAHLRRDLEALAADRDQGA